MCINVRVIYVKIQMCPVGQSEVFNSDSLLHRNITDFTAKDSVIVSAICVFRHVHHRNRINLFCPSSGNINMLLYS